MQEKIHFFDAIATNKRNSIILMLGMFVLSLVFLFVALSVFVDYFSAIILSFFISSIYILLAYNQSLNLILKMSDAKLLERKDHPYLHHIVEGLSIASGIPIPKTYIMNDDSPNAFAAGKDPEHSILVVTKGLLEKLDKRELSGVIAHEVSHIANYDIRYATLAVVIVGFVAVISQVFGRMILFSSHRSRKSGGPFLIIAIIMMILAPIFAELVRFALSRQREFLADANGSRLTRDPEALISALEKISLDKGNVKNASNVTAPLYFANPLKGKFIGLFATHPPIKERVERLGQM